MLERLQKIISARGVASRRKAEDLILQGKVSVNGITAQLGDRANPDIDIILVEGKALPSAQKYIYLMLNKPRGYVTTLFDEKGRPTASSLVSDCGQRVYPIGRLDMDSEGLLLFTNDGEFANRTMHPSHEIQKTYEVTVTGFLQNSLSLLERPIVLDGYQIRKPTVVKLSSNEQSAKLLITIHEGRNRQIRRMCDAAGMKVVRLKRVQEGALRLGNLPAGKWRYLTEDEIQKI